MKVLIPGHCIIVLLTRMWNAALKCECSSEISVQAVERRCPFAIMRLCVSCHLICFSWKSSQIHLSYFPTQKEHGTKRKYRISFSDNFYHLMEKVIVNLLLFITFEWFAACHTACNKLFIISVVCHSFQCQNKIFLTENTSWLTKRCSISKYRLLHCMQA